MEIVGNALHLGLSTDIMPVPYIGPYLALDAYGAGPLYAGISAEDRDMGAHIGQELRKGESFDAQREGGTSIAASVGVVFNPVAIRLPATPHLLNIRIDAGGVGFNTLRWSYDVTDNKHEYYYSSGFSWTLGGELSYSYRFGQLFSLGAYYQLRMMPPFTSSVGLCFGLHFRYRAGASE